MSAETTGTPTLETLAARLAEFARERDWDRFHSPKNLAMALAGEAGELLEHFQWLTEAESRALPAEVNDAVALEMADVLLYLVRLADTLGVDLAAAAARKITLNAEKYPVDRFRGSARKYDRDR
ncbi:MAG TPA: nucleotide pyrophosphohydrolase [Steroidobacteraceae bacterium]|jgi:dCTP diphosphatase